LSGAEIPVVVTYHPSAVLRDKAGLRKPVWDDLKLLKSLLEK
jgi:uracil-DNA glycosylase